MMLASPDLFEWNRPKSAARLRFEEFDAANPEVYRLFKRFSLQAIRAGRRKFGARLITERIRWEMSINTTGDEFKLNDHYAPFYVRKFIREFPEHKDIFEMRTSLADT